VRLALRERPLGLALAWAVWSVTVLILAQSAVKLPEEVPDRTPPGLSARSVPPLARWDSAWYYRIAVHGYSYDPASPQASIGFYPLYPLLVGGIVRLIHTPVFWTGIALSLVCFLGGLFLLRDLARAWKPEGELTGTIDAILFFPTAFFFAAFYTESLFLLTSAAALWGARRGQWLVAGIGAIAAALTRLNGALILLPMLLVAAQDAGWRPRGLRWKPLLAIFAGAVGAAAYPAYLWYRWGSPLLYINAKNNVMGVTQGFRPPTHLLRLAGKRIFQLASEPGSGGQIRAWLELACLIGFTVLTVLLFRRRLWPEAWYCAVTVLLFWCAGSFDGVNRYVLALFPCFFVIGDILGRRQSAAFAYRFVGASLNTLLLIRFVRWLWVA
jgi:mannosyltransferase PIG-V